MPIPPFLFDPFKADLKPHLVGNHGRESERDGRVCLHFSVRDTGVGISTEKQAVIFEPFERTRCLLIPKDGGPALASVNFWNMETMIGTLGVHAVGIVGLEVAPKQRRQGLAKFLLGEALRQLHAQHVALAEVHVAEENATALTLFGSLGFNQVDSSILYCKDCRNADK